MLDKSKRKNNKLPLTTYDQLWLFDLYRWLGWDKTQTMTVQASTEAALAHIQRLEDRMRYDYTVQSQQEGNHQEFNVDVTSIARSGKSYNYTSLATIVGTIQEDDQDASKSLVAFRAYPGGIASRVFLTAILLLAIRLFGSTQTIDPFNIAMMIMATVGLIFIWHAHFANRNEGLELVTDHFVSILRLSEKMKTDTHSLVEGELYEHQAQERRLS